MMTISSTFSSLRQRRPMSRDKADTLLLLASCSLVLAPQTTHLPIWASILSVCMLLWRGWVTFRGNRMPSQWLLMPIATASMVSVYFTYHSFFGRDSGVAMVALLLTFKLLEMRAKRDLFAVVLVSFFVILTNFLYSQSIGTAALMAAALILLLTTQLSFQYTNHVPSLAKRLRLSAIIFGLSVPLTILLFVLFPRMQGPLWSMPGDASSGKTGLSDSMSPGNISDLAQSDEIAFRVKFKGAPPPQSKLYWRAIILDFYDGKTWTHKGSRSRIIPNTVVNPHGNATDYQVTLEATGQRWLFALDLPLTAPVVSDNPADFSSDMQLRAEHPIDQRIRYDASSYIDYDLEAGTTAPVSPLWLQLPPALNPKTREFAANLRRQTDDNQQIINTILQYFHNQKFSYTLQPPLLGENAVDEFLFTTNAGFCEHYAGAFVFLMRAMGIPSRVVTGYQGGDLNPVDGYMEIRQSDAHAWAEVWLKNRGWVRFDPTAAVAPERIQRNFTSMMPRTAFGGLITLNGSKESWLGKLRFDWGALNNAWNQWVLSYDVDKQKHFIQSFGFEDIDWRTLAALLAVSGSAVVGVITLLLLMKRQKRDPVQALFQTLCEQLARASYPRNVHEGPRAYEQRINAPDCTLPSARKAAITRFLALYETIRYGTPEQSTPAHQLTQLKTLLAHCK